MADIPNRLKAALADRYQIEQELGSGGMATVFLAEDVKHRRKVAIKVLRPELAAVVGTERFLTEIEVTAKLQHPHIVPLFDSGTAAGLPYYVMPYVEGESLQERLERTKHLSIEETVEIATAVAGALAYAHAHGVIHRDIKPANIMLRRDATVVTDFGIALAVTAAGGQRLTETGLLIGTPEYMSPEQASAAAVVDARTDQYALACVVYEMLAGEPPHTGATIQAIIAKVMTESPRRLRAARDTVPPHMEVAVHRALTKLPTDRYRSVETFAEALANPSASGQWMGWLPGLARITTKQFANRAALLLLAGAAVWGWLRASPADPAPTVRFAIPYPVSESFGASRYAVAVSPDGSVLAYVARAGTTEQLFLREIDQLESRVVPGTDGAFDPFFSADGQWLGFATVVGLLKVPVAGGPPETIIEFPEPRGGSWEPNDEILFGSTSGLWRVSASGGSPERLTTVSAERGELMHSRPKRLPGGESILFTITHGHGTVAEKQAAVLSLESGEIARLFPGISPRYSTTGHLIYGRSDSVLAAVPFDARHLETAGSATPLISGVAIKPAGTMDFEISASGSLVYLTGADPGRRLVLVDRNGNVTALDVAPDLYVSPKFSPDGQRIAVGRGSPPTRQIWMYDMAERTLTPITFEGHNYYPVWNADGTRLAFTTETSTGADIRWRSAYGSGSTETLLRADPGVLVYPESWSPDGRYLVYREQDARSGRTDRDLWVLTVDGSQPPRRLLDLPSLEEAPRISPDGSWLAFASDLSGRYEIYVTRFPDPGRRHVVSLEGGTEPGWSPDGREVFYRNGNQMIAARIETTPQFRVVERVVLFSGRYSHWPFSSQYDMHPDGQRFAMVVPPPEDRASRVVVVVNWIEELRQALRRSAN